MKRALRIGLLALLSLSATAATSPRALAPAAGGLWEVATDATGHNAEKVCVPLPEVLAQYEHRSGRCTRVVISDVGTEVVIHYTCADGAFGQSKVTLITPRTLRIDTQGISGGLPFHYQLHARRVGACVAR
ncbi:MAG: hypothetical protein H0W65_02040 [Sphingomonas sp.]|uniref:DUF3617 domain-containing protein n=1 Tax=Sphingomonas sp. TaxID=28214 RepID=UPI001812947B|nr:DUF3617 family protein [Sphingomonas sp.]MBA3666489.1 hypothetical protein [Sphingomonas sp.]